MLSNDYLCDSETDLHLQNLLGDQADQHSIFGANRIKIDGARTVILHVVRRSTRRTHGRTDGHTMNILSVKCRALHRMDR